MALTVNDKANNNAELKSLAESIKKDNVLWPPQKMVGPRTLQEELAACPGLSKQDVLALREWAKKQPHLPNLDDLPEDTMDVYIAMMLKRRYNSVERTKELLDNYFVFRDLTPELSRNRSTKRPEVQTYLSMNYTMVMDKRDVDGNIVVVQNLHDPDLKGYDLDSSTKTIIMVMESWFYENGSAGAPGVTILLDQKNFSMSHMATVNLATIKKLNHFNKDCSPISVKNIYITNATSFIQTILTLIKPMVHGDLFQRIVSFTPDKMNELYKRVPREALPNEYGGTAGSMEDLDMKSVKRLERCEKIFAAFDRAYVNESKRLGPQKDSNSMFGLEGSFKKLNVD